MVDRAGLIYEVARGVRDPHVLAALAAVPRDLFVPEHLRELAWENAALPIGEGQTISQPYVVARMCELLELRGDESVLDVGTGSGYHAAVLAQLAARVVSIERLRFLSRRARAALDAAGVRNVTLVVGDGTEGWKEQAPYDAILVAAGGPVIPQPLVDQLADGGRMVIPVGAGTDSQVLTLVRRRGTEVITEKLDDVVFVPLIGRHGRREE